MQSDIKPENMLILYVTHMHNTRAAISLNRNKLNRPNLRYGGDEIRSMRLIFEAITNKRYLHAKQTNTNEATFTIAF